MNNYKDSNGCVWSIEDIGDGKHTLISVKEPDAVEATEYLIPTMDIPGFVMALKSSFLKKQS